MNWTVEQYNEYMENRRFSKNGKNLLKSYGKRPSAFPKQAKFRNRKVEVDGHVFDSEREADVYSKLKMCQDSGIISDLELQPKFILLPSFKDKSGVTHRQISYIADFRYKETGGHIVVIDVKSKVTASHPVYRLKKKLLMYHYPEIDFREVF